MWNELTAPYKQIVTVGGKLPMKVSINKTTQKKMISNQKYYFLFFSSSQIGRAVQPLSQKKSLNNANSKIPKMKFFSAQWPAKYTWKVEKYFSCNLITTHMSETIFRKALIILNAVLSLTARSRDLVCLRQIPVPLS